jgi:hypothetical protein
MYKDNINCDIIIDNIMYKIDTIEKMNYHYNMFREYKDQIHYYESDFNSLNKYGVLLEMADELGLLLYERVRLTALWNIKFPFDKEDNYIIKLFSKNIAYNYLKNRKLKLENRIYFDLEEII